MPGNIRAVLSCLGGRPAGRHRPAVPRPRHRHVRRPAGSRGSDPRLQRQPPVPLHSGLCRSLRAPGSDRRRPGRGVDRGPVPAGRRRGLHGRTGERPHPAGLRAGRHRLAARRAPGTPVARVALLQAVSGLRTSAAALRTVVWSLLAVLVFGLLFASADAVFAEWAGAIVPDLNLDSFVLRAFITVAVGGVVLAATYLGLNPPNVEPRRRSGAAGRTPVRVAGAGAARGRGLPGVPRRAGDGELRRARLPRADHRAHLRGVRPPGLRPAHCGHRTHPARGVGRRPQGTAYDACRRGLAARVARPALLADPGRGRLRSLPDARLPGGLRLHRAPPARRRLRGLAGSAGARRDWWPA